MTKNEHHMLGGIINLWLLGWASLIGRKEHHMLGVIINLWLLGWALLIGRKEHHTIPGRHGLHILNVIDALFRC
jgi:hypothetical protein